MAVQDYVVASKRFLSYRKRKFLQRFLAVVLASLFLSFVSGSFSPIPALVGDPNPPSYTKDDLKLVKGALTGIVAEAEADPVLIPLLDNPFVLVGATVVAVGVVWYFYSQAQQQAAHQLAEQRYYQAYCHLAIGDPLCGSVFDLSFYSPNNRAWLTYRFGLGKSFLDWKIEECIWDYGGGRGPQDVGPSFNYQDSTGVWTDQGYGGSCSGPGIDTNTITITPVTPLRLPWKEWPQSQRNTAVALLTDDDWLSNLAQSPQGGVLQPGAQLSSGYYSFSSDGSAPSAHPPITIPDGNPNPIPTPTPSGPPQGTPPLIYPPTSPSPDPTPSPSPTGGSSPPTASGGDQPPDDSSSLPPEPDGPDDPAADANIAPSDQYLDARAKELAQLMDSFAQTRRTIAVGRVRNSDGTKAEVVASSNGYLNPAQTAAMNQAGETIIPDDKSKTHAEIRIILWAEANGKTVEAIAASRNICSVCWAAMQPENIRPATNVNLPKTQP